MWLGWEWVDTFSRNCAFGAWLYKTHIFVLNAETGFQTTCDVKSSPCFWLLLLWLIYFLSNILTDSFSSSRLIFKHNIDVLSPQLHNKWLQICCQGLAYLPIQKTQIFRVLCVYIQCSLSTEILLVFANCNGLLDIFMRDKYSTRLPSLSLIRCLVQAKQHTVASSEDFQLKQLRLKIELVRTRHQNSKVTICVFTSFGLMDEWMNYCHALHLTMTAIESDGCNWTSVWNIPRPRYFYNSTFMKYFLFLSLEFKISHV